MSGVGVIYLVRHGQASPQAYGALAGDRAAGGLTDLGREQLRLTGKVLSERVHQWSSVVTGTLARQQESLDLILESFPAELRPVVDHRWDEYDLDAILGGTGRATRSAGPDRGLQRVVDEAVGRWVAGEAMETETYAEFTARCADALGALRRFAGRGQTALVVTSAGVIMNLVSQLWSVDPQSWIAMARTVVNGSISKFIVGDRGVSVVSVNEHLHLDGVEGVGSRRYLTFR